MSDRAQMGPTPLWVPFSLLTVTGLLLIVADLVGVSEPAPPHMQQYSSAAPLQLLVTGVIAAALGLIAGIVVQSGVIGGRFQ